VNELRDLYSAETQLVEALPKMANAAASVELKEAFTNHLAQTRTHVQRIEQILQNLPEKAKGETCDAMKGLIKKGENYVKAGASG
jgi:ferritin-like metal-binding protein YciE